MTWGMGKKVTRPAEYTAVLSLLLIRKDWLSKITVSLNIAIGIIAMNFRTVKLEL